jgi:hydrogenase nickel incorporation protein HypB
MCKTSSASDASVSILPGPLVAAAPHPHNHGRDQRAGSDSCNSPSHEQVDQAGRILKVGQAVLGKNNELAKRNRDWLASRRIVALNLMSSPGAGKTALLERTLRDLGNDIPMYVIEGDQATDHDSQRIRAAGGRVVQINTGAGCHLDAAMVARALEELDPSPGSLLFIENVGNLVCPANFDLGERAKVVICSVTEGDDKPAKYPHMFRASSFMVLNKIDLLPYVPFDTDRCLQFVSQVNPAMRLVRLSATRGDGLAEWYSWLRQETSS